ncbi:MAG: putative metal-binding motif-containing protein [Nitrospirae bacterium]|nr:putative metal-binding motif-containing protein [Nitrospirota bacterium]
MDVNNKAHIIYRTETEYTDLTTNNYLKYATNASGSWVTYTLFSGEIYRTSIATDSNNKAYISYNPPNYSLKYMTNASGSWANYTIDEGDVGSSSSIAIDLNDNIHIGYSDGMSDLKYATNTQQCIDNDGDGYGNPGNASCPNGSVTDCDESNPAVNPGATETPNNGIDDDCNPATPVASVSGNAYNYPIPLFRASMSVNVNASSLGTSYLRYYYTRNRLSLVSTSITGISASGGTATVTGAGSVNGAAGYTFTATISDGSPDTMGLEIKKPDGTNYFSTSSQAVISGNFTVVGQ